MSCEKCKGSGYIISNTGKMQECSCILQERIEKYSRHYNKYKIVKKYVDGKYNTNLIIRNASVDTFGRIVKSLIVYQFLKNRDSEWKDITGQELVNTTFGDGEVKLDELEKVDLLIIKLGRDGYNKAVGMWMLNLLTKRLEQGLYTVIYVYPNVSRGKLVDLYSKELIDYIESDESEFKDISKLVKE